MRLEVREVLQVVIPVNRRRRIHGADKQKVFSRSLDHVCYQIFELLAGLIRGLQRIDIVHHILGQYRVGNPS